MWYDEKDSEIRKYSYRTLLHYERMKGTDKFRSIRRKAMNTQQFYQIIGGNYAETMGRFVTEERVLRFVRKFPADGSFATLKSSLDAGSQEEAFRAAHTLKGVAQNLGFNALFEKAAQVTDILRGGSMEVAAQMEELEQLYRLTVESIAALD